MAYSTAEIASIRTEYPEGTRIRLKHMDESKFPVADGTTGKVTYVDDNGQIHMRWDNGRTLSLVPGVDDFDKI
jgi:hypothetical protein